MIEFALYYVTLKRTPTSLQYKFTNHMSQIALEEQGVLEEVF